MNRNDFRWLQEIQVTCHCCGDRWPYIYLINIDDRSANHLLNSLILDAAAHRNPVSSEQLVALLRPICLPCLLLPSAHSTFWRHRELNTTAEATQQTIIAGAFQNILLAFMHISDPSHFDDPNLITALALSNKTHGLSELIHWLYQWSVAYWDDRKQLAFAASPFSSYYSWRQNISPHLAPTMTYKHWSIEHKQELPHDPNH